MSMIYITEAKKTLAMQCLICGEGVELNEFEEKLMLSGLPVTPKICDECKKAVLWARKQGVSE